MSADRVPVLLGDGAYYGTLAAARALGREGVRVDVADPSRVAAALWSRHVGRRLRCPPASDVARFVPWLAELGRAGERHVVCATSDDWSFALALRRAELEGPLVLYQPPLEALLGLLDKGRLLGHARAAGIEVPETWLPASEADVARALDEAGGGALVVKPRTQALLRTHAKGLVLRAGTNADAALSAYDLFRRKNRHGEPLASSFPEMTWPLVQRFHAEAVDRVYSLAGFRDRTGRAFVVKAADKVLQRPRPLGIGICFEDAPVDPDLASRVRALCERIGYFGIFEAEFIRVGGRSLLIDLNARIYNQLGFDVARGLPLPRMLYDAALGRDDEVAARAAAVRDGAGAAATNGSPAPRAFCNRFGLAVLVRAQRVAGGMTRDEAEHWRAWLRDRDGAVLDAVADADDPRPLAFEIAQQVYSYVRHPRAFVRMIASRP